jgi:hypothetical protein
MHSFKNSVAVIRGDLLIIVINGKYIGTIEIEEDAVVCGVTKDLKLIGAQ